MAKLRSIITDDPHTWDEAWNQNVTPWDAGEIQPPLREVTQSGEINFPASGRAFVPGCGSDAKIQSVTKGYDAIYIASELGLETLAIDISPAAVKNASKTIPQGLNTRIEVHDFFSFTVPDERSFFVAIPPSRRQEWGSQINALIKPGGYLITLVYPLDPETDAGPPWFVRPEHYLAPLREGWEKVVDRIPTVSSPTHVGRERLVVWKKLQDHLRFLHPTMTDPQTGAIDFTYSGETFQTSFEVFGDLKQGRPLVALHGGPGIPHQYLLPIAALAASRSIPIVFYDQIGCGRSSLLPHKTTKFWTPELFMAELDTVLAHFGIAEDFDLYGHSWGGMLAANYVISRNPQGLKRLIISDATPSLELWAAGANFLLSGFPEAFQEMLKRHESAGTTDSEEYQHGIQQFNEKHMCTLKPWPNELLSAFEAVEADATVYSTMIGPSEFNVTGTLKTWTVVDDLPKITVPTLLINGRYEAAQDFAVAPFFHRMPKVKWVQFAASSHMPFFEEKERYLQVVGDFLCHGDY
ncbi:Alpha/Beta hydrolase protein [Mycena crocata]|nr:Alpha/Beta hydrolase protein [Mycena crocata]